MEILEFHGARQLEVAGETAPDLLRAAADWLDAHPDLTISAVALSRVGEADPSGNLLLTVALADDNTTLAGEPASPRMPIAAVSRPFGTARAQAWSVDLAEQVLREAQPSGLAFLRALIDEGGQATAARLRELTGQDKLHYSTLTLNHSARRVAGHGLLPDGRTLVLSRTAPGTPRQGRVHDYQLPEHLIPLFAEALERLGH